MKKSVFILTLMLAILLSGVTNDKTYATSGRTESTGKIMLKGSSKERGHQYGKQAKTAIQHNINQFKRQVRTEGFTTSAIKKESHQYENYLQTHNPKMMDMMKGIAASADIAYHDLLAFNALQEEVMPEGCTTIIAAGDATKNGDVFYHKNRDATRGYKQVVVQVDPQKGYDYVGITSAGYTGIAMGINENGVSVGNNVLSTWDIGEGYGNLTIIRMALEQSKNARHAVNIIKDLPRSWGSTYGIADEKEAAFLETTHSANAVKWIQNGAMAHTNHYIFPGMKKYDTSNIEDNQQWSWYISTDERLDRANQLLNQDYGKIGYRDLIEISEDQYGKKKVFWIDSQAQIDGVKMGSVSAGTFDGDDLRMWSQLGQPSSTPAIPFETDRPIIPKRFSHSQSNL